MKIPSSHHLIPEFDPETQQTNEWIKKVDDSADVYGWPDTTITHLATFRFAGIAKDWYNSLPTLRKTGRNGIYC